MVAFHDTARAAKPSPVHKLFKEWESQGRLLRLYSQNIDGLEREAGLSVVSLGEHGPSTGRCWEIPQETVVQLHGCLRYLRLRCTICHGSEEWNKNDLIAILDKNDVPRCSLCRQRRPSSLARPQRRSAEGVLRPDVILLNEIHPFGDEIGLIMAADGKERPDLVLVIGTELTVPGVRDGVRAFKYEEGVQKGTNESDICAGPLVVFVNRTPLPANTYMGVADFALWISCEQFLGLLGKEHLALSASQAGEEDHDTRQDVVENDEGEEEDVNDTGTDDSDGECEGYLHSWLSSMNAMRGEVITLRMEVLQMQIDGLRRLAADNQAMAGYIKGNEVKLDGVRNGN